MLSQESGDFRLRISNERYEFLMYILFGSEKNPYIASSKVAYRDLCRTLRFGTMGGGAYRKHVDSILKDRAINIVNHKRLTQSDYDVWHESVCDELVTYYSSIGIAFTVGHAQKWLNMMMKYLYIRGHASIINALLTHQINGRHSATEVIELGYGK